MDRSSRTTQQIGVVIARSDQSAFATTVQKQSGVEGVSATTRFGVGFRDESADSVTADAPAPGSDGEPLSGLQWDMEQINAFAAHEISGGDPDVIVGDLDTGLDFTHPDLAPNYRADLSADCSSGAASPLPANNDANGHGTHTAGTIAAAVNGIGVTGVAPNVGLAGVKTSNDDGFFFPEMVICAYMWVAAKGIDVTNNSYFADPWLYNCVNDPANGRSGRRSAARSVTPSPRALSWCHLREMTAPTCLTRPSTRSARTTRRR